MILVLVAATSCELPSTQTAVDSPSANVDETSMLAEVTDGTSEVSMEALAPTREPVDCSEPIEIVPIVASKPEGDYKENTFHSGKTFSDCEKNGFLFASDFEEGECVSVEHFSEYKCLVLDADATLCDDQAGAYNMTVLIDGNDAVLDCQNQAIDHRYPAPEIVECRCNRNVYPDAAAACGSEEPRRKGIVFPRHRSIHGVRIRDCEIRNIGFNAVEMKRDFRAAELDATLEGHADIEITGLRTRNVGAAVYVGQASRDILISDARVVASRLFGFYIESASEGVVVENSSVVWSLSREGIAVDSASNNTIRGNVFSMNCGGDGVAIYHNCGEFNLCPTLRGPASHNQIKENVFETDGLAIAPRQGGLRSGGWCAEVGSETSRQWDEAPDNTVVGNTFFVDRRLSGLGSRSGKPVIRHGPALLIQDSGTRVQGNFFFAHSWHNRGGVAIKMSEGYWPACEPDGPEVCDVFAPPFVGVTDTSLEDNTFVGLDLLVSLPDPEAPDAAAPDATYSQALKEEILMNNAPQDFPAPTSETIPADLLSIL